MALAALATTLVPTRTHAADRWTRPYTGVRMLHRTSRGTDLHVVLVDLANPAVSIVATRPEDRFIRTTEFAHRYGAQIAVNANFFDHGPCGLAVGDGVVMDRAYEERCRASIAFGRANEASIFDSDQHAAGPVPDAWMTDVLSGKPWLLRDGRTLDDDGAPHHLTVANPRTAVGLTPDHHTLVIVSSDGRRGAVRGLTGAQLVTLFREFGASDAFNLDGGGSTTLVVGDRVRNHLPDRFERPVMSHLGIRIRTDAVWSKGSFTGVHALAPTRVGESTRVSFEARNDGRRPWVAGTSPHVEIDAGTGVTVLPLVHGGASGETARFEAKWTPRNGGTRAVRVLLRDADGAVLAEQRIENVRVGEAAPIVPSVAVVRASVGGVPLAWRVNAVRALVSVVGRERVRAARVVALLLFAVALVRIPRSRRPRD